MTGKFTKHQPLEKRKNFKGKPILIHKNFVRETENTKICSTRYCQPSETRKTQPTETRKFLNGQPVVMSTNRDTEISQWATTRNFSQIERRKSPNG